MKCKINSICQLELYNSKSYQKVSSKKKVTKPEDAKLQVIPFLMWIIKKWLLQNYLKYYFYKTLNDLF